MAEIDDNILINTNKQTRNKYNNTDSFYKSNHDVADLCLRMKNFAKFKSVNFDMRNVKHTWSKLCLKNFAWPFSVYNNWKGNSIHDTHNSSIFSAFKKEVMYFSPRANLYEATRVVYPTEKTNCNSTLSWFFASCSISVKFYQKKWF